MTHRSGTCVDLNGDACVKGSLKEGQLALAEREALHSSSVRRSSRYCLGEVCGLWASSVAASLDGFSRKECSEMVDESDVILGVSTAWSILGNYESSKTEM
eukprot:TRINITY_DN17399_c0_g2_i7.p3 TRINITY_DN17399_c0_g2~~TRINITY_DN17399_c0_g2_i7.p3  ORF type:complete len:101 (+),score=12.46 TRINITY_DN17399_c0_g2_i7:1054-1356(+)